MTLSSLISDAKRLDALVSLLERADGFWQCNHNARVNRMYYVCHVSESPEAALSFAITLFDQKIDTEGVAKKMELLRIDLNIDDLLADL